MNTAGAILGSIAGRIAEKRLIDIEVLESGIHLIHTNTIHKPHRVTHPSQGAATGAEPSVNEFGFLEGRQN